jgi:WXG100 family type VII secretion target
MADDVRIKVSTEALTNTAGTLQGSVRRMNVQYDALYRKIQGLSAYWKGAASQKTMEQCSKDYKMVAQMLKRLQEYPDDLFKMAGIYASAEKGNVSSGESLPSNLII